MGDTAELKLFVVLCKTFASVSGEAKKDIKRYGLSLSEFEALELLYHKGPQRVQDIGKKVLLTSGSMTYVVDQMVKKELCTRSTCPSDKRVTYVLISEKGTKLMDEIFPQHSRRIAKLFSPLCEEQIVGLTEALKQVSKSITNERRE